MSDTSRVPTEVLNPYEALLGERDLASAAQAAAVAAAEAIAAHAAAHIAAEAVSTAGAMVLSANAAAARAATRAQDTAQAAAAAAAQAANDIATEAAATAEATVMAATAAAATAAAAATHRSTAATEAETAADLAAEASSTAQAMVRAATAAAAAALVRAERTAQAVADASAQVAADLQAEAATTARAMIVAATAAAAETIAAATATAAAAWTVDATDPVSSPAVRAPVPDQVSEGWEPLHTEFASLLADPVLPRFRAPAQDSVLSYESPGELGLWRDLSLAGRLRAELRVSEGKHETAFDCAPTALLVAWLPDGRPVRFVQVNQALCRLTGRSALQLLGSGFADLAHPRREPLDEGDLFAPGAPTDLQRVQRWEQPGGADLWVRLHIVVLPPATAEAGRMLVCHVEDLLPQHR